MSHPSAFDVSPKIASIRRGLVLRASSALLTVFGDSIAAPGRAVWLGSVIELAQMFGLSPRLVRTSASRLKADDWFVVTRIGRHSYYELSDVGAQRVLHADRRIHDFELPRWDGRWTLVLLNAAMRASARQRLERELTWEGFGRLAPGVFGHPHADHDTLGETLAASGVQDLVAVLSAEGIDAYSRASLPHIVRSTFRQAQAETAWHRFIARFAPVDVEALTPAEAFFVRILLVHEYRRVLMRHPNLPRALLPADWPGIEALRLFDRLYGQLLGPSELFLQAHMRLAEPSLSRASTTAARQMPAPVPLALAA